MAVLTFNKKQFEQDVGKLDEKMQSRIAMFGTPIDRITDTEIQIEIFPNRPDLLSYHGFKRSFMAFLDKKTGLKVYAVKKPEKDYAVTIDSSVKDIRPFTACAIVRDLELDNNKIKELIDMQEKLHITIGRKRKKMALGIYPLDKIKLPITFKAIEPDQVKFMPLEMSKELSGLEILQKHPTGKEYAHLLAGKTKFPVFVDSTGAVLSMPPIVNSQNTGKVTVDCRDVFVECSGFDLEFLKMCLNIVVTSMAEMGGKIYQMDLKYGYKKECTPELEPKKLKISIENVNRVLGLDLKEGTVKDLLERMSYGYKSGIVEVPAWRTDILQEIDLIEDVAIAYGYENFIPEIPEIATVGEQDKSAVFTRKISDILSGLGFLEVSNYHLTTKQDQTEKMGSSEKKIDFIEVTSSKTEYTALRKNLSHYLMKNLSENVDSEYPQKIFEIGRIFTLNSGNIEEKESLALALTPGNFTEVKQTLEYLGRMLNLSLDFKEAEDCPDHFIKGRTGKVMLAGSQIGFIGEIKPEVLQNWRMKMSVALFEVDLEKILSEMIK